MKRDSAAGFALPAALFLLVVLGGLAAWLMHMTELGMAQDALEIEGERAYQAAQAGLEAGLHAVKGGTCGAQTITFTGGLSRFTASVACSQATADEGDAAAPAKFYVITSVACNQPDGGACPNTSPSLIEYTERHVRAVLEGS